jgi:hypothetical protein
MPKNWRKIKLCECGCGEIVKLGNKFIRGHHGRCFSKESRLKIALARLGKRSYFYGKFHTEETKAKMSEIHSGEKNSMYGKKHTEESRLIMSEVKLGKNSHNWIDGRSYRGRGDAWKDKEYYQYILERDEFKCQCPDHNHNYKINRLDRHHIDFDKTNHHFTNLITLCVGCHTHKAHGSNKIEYQEVFRGIIEGKLLAEAYEGVLIEKRH